MEAMHSSVGEFVAEHHDFKYVLLKQAVGQKRFQNGLEQALATPCA